MHNTCTQNWRRTNMNWEWDRKRVVVDEIAMKQFQILDCVAAFVWIWLVRDIYKERTQLEVKLMKNIHHHRTKSRWNSRIFPYFISNELFNALCVLFWNWIQEKLPRWWTKLNEAIRTGEQIIHLAIKTTNKIRCFVELYHFRCEKSVRYLFRLCSVRLLRSSAMRNRVSVHV